jgi:release factor glutamine methyltransferase
MYHMTSTSNQTGSPTWTTRTLLEWIEGHLVDKGVDAPKVVSRHLVAESIGCDVMDLFTDPDRRTTDAERATLRAFVARATAGEPLQQLLGRSGFMLRDFQVTNDVLVPRDATESLVRAVMTWVRGIDAEQRPDPLMIADVGTGSGCIAVTLALELPASRIQAIDCSEAALVIASANIEQHSVSTQVMPVQGDVLETVTDPVHIVVSNPPYISDERFDALDATVKAHEPAVALRGGPDGLDVVRRLVESAPSKLLAGGLLAMEVDDWHVHTVADLCTEAGLLDARVLRDAWGDERIVLATTPEM